MPRKDGVARIYNNDHIKGTTQLWLWQHHKLRQLTEDMIPYAACSILQSGRHSGNREGRIEAALAYPKGRSGRSRVNDAYAVDTFKRLVLDKLGLNSVDEWKWLTEASLKDRALPKGYRLGAQVVMGKLEKLFRLTEVDAKYLVQSYYYKSPYGSGDERSLVSLSTTNKLWRSFNRGRDFFLPGLGTFEVEDPLFKESALATGVPKAITYFGYMTKTEYHRDISGMPRISSQVVNYLIPLSLQFGTEFDDYFVKWYEELMETCSNNTIDEIGRGLLELGLDIARSPRDTIHDYEIVRNERFSNKAPTVLADHKYTKAEQLPELTIGEHVVHPINNYGQLCEVAKALHNCARSYHSELDRGSTHLICVRTREGKPVALAQLNPKSLKYSQMVETCNKSASDEIESVYTQYLERSK